ncbi:P-loop containing nucleoside triphosphate hydrolase protein [Umbelopsis sp. AD052]|nr:P-loop containing nucleoside triphosphate hydrolase protein [Umbelopsis sp. AD052]
MSDQPCIQFVVLFTAQKLKKSKTWQDGFLKFYDFNKKMILIDEKGYNIDRKFQKGKRPPQVGDEIEFDGHLVTVENIAEDAVQPEPESASIPNPQIVSLESKRQQAQKSASFKLRAKWKPPTITNMSDGDVQSSGTNFQETFATEMSDYVPKKKDPVIKIEQVVEDPVIAHNQTYTETLSRNTTTEQIVEEPVIAHNQKFTETLSRKKTIEQVMEDPVIAHNQKDTEALSRDATIEKKKDIKDGSQPAFSKELHTTTSGPYQTVMSPKADIAPEPNVQRIAQKSIHQPKTNTPSVDKPLPVVTLAAAMDASEDANNKLARFRYPATPATPKIDEPVLDKSDYQDNIAVVEEELSELQVEEPSNKRDIQFTPSHIAEDRDMDTPMEEMLPVAGDDQRPHQHVITPSAANNGHKGNRLGDHHELTAQEQQNAASSPVSYNSNVPTNTEDKEINAGQKRPVIDNTSEELPSAKRRIMVGLSKTKRQPLTAKSSTTVADNALLKSSFVKASEIRDIPVPNQTDPKHNVNKPQNSNPPKIHPQKSNPPKSHKAPALIPMVNSTSKGFSIPSVIHFPNASKAAQALQIKKGTSRRLTVPARFTSVSQYVDTFTKLIQEHLQVLLQTYASYFYAQSKDWTQVQNPEQLARSRGLGLHMNASLARSDRYISGDLDYCLSIRNPQHRSKYGKDDIWVVSKSLQFEPSSTFLAKSTFFGPVGGSQLEIQCLTPRDGRIAGGMCKGMNSLVALRTVSASNEFMMLAALMSNIDEAPLLPAILSYDNGSRPKRKQLHDIPKASKDDGKIVIFQSDGIDLNTRVNETIKRFTLNEDQARVLVATSESIIDHPQSTPKQPISPIVLVHGVFGSGKSYLAAVLIIFIQELVDDINCGREPEDRIAFNILVTSITNVAVDRILLSLLDLGYDDFVRVGSLRKIAKPILPHTIQSRVGKDGDIKELEAMLKDDAMSANDMSSVETALQKFQKAESQAQMSDARVIGTTCVASVFEIFNDLTVPLILLDEASQIMEPMAMVSITKFFADRLILIGDPLQLPPTLVTPCEPDIVGQGIEKTLFDRCAEMGIPPIMLRTQYRCHPKISRLSNNLFYERRLIDGMREIDRPPLFAELPHVCFVNTNGTEMKRPGTQSYHNDMEVRVATQVVQALVRLGISPIDIGVISLYKEQADKIEHHLKSMSQSVFGSVQVSTVDAFQGAEKQVIVLCTVRTNPSNFIDNPQRINVALSRAKSHMIILGKQDVLSMNQLWSCILKLTKDACLESAQLLNLLAQISASRRAANVD